MCFALVLAWKDFTNDLQPIFSSYTLREKCPYFPAFRLNTERYFSRSERDKPIDVTASSQPIIWYKYKVVIWLIFWGAEESW